MPNCRGATICLLLLIIATLSYCMDVEEVESQRPSRRLLPKGELTANFHPISYGRALKMMKKKKKKAINFLGNEHSDADEDADTGVNFSKGKGKGKGGSKGMMKKKSMMSKGKGKSSK